MELITKRIPLSDAPSPLLGWAVEAVKSYGVDPGEAQLVRKGITPSDTQFKEGENASVDYITTKVKDRDNEIVVPKGIVLDDYNKHPVVLYCHNYRPDDVPPGRNMWIKPDEKGLIAKTEYYVDDKDSIGHKIYNYRKAGFPMAKSIGFIPLEVVEEKDFGTLNLKELDLTEEDLKGAARVYPKSLLLEYSDVPVPSNPDALQLAVSKGLFPDIAGAKRAADEDNAFVILADDKPTHRLTRKEIVNKPETTDDYHHIPVRDKGDFVADSFRTIDLSKDEGIKAVIGKLKSDPQGSTQVQKYLFETGKWSMEDAKKWVDDHKKDVSIKVGDDGKEFIEIAVKFSHNSNVSDSEPSWSSVDKKSLPRLAFANMGETGNKSTWSYPHHYIVGGGSKSDDGVYTTGTMYLHKGGLNVAWAAAQGARSGEEATPAIKSHLNAHRKALGMEKADDGDYVCEDCGYIGMEKDICPKCSGPMKPRKPKKADDGDFYCKCEKCGYKGMSTTACPSSKCPECGAMMSDASGGEEVSDGKKIVITLGGSQHVDPDALNKIAKEVSESYRRGSIPSEKFRKENIRTVFSVGFGDKTKSFKPFVPGKSKGFDPEKEKNVRWNPNLSKDFDITEEEFSPGTAEYELIRKFLDCPMKEINEDATVIPSAMMGNYLSGLKSATKEWEVKDMRNITRHGEEIPLVREVIQLNSKGAEEFLVEGTIFYEALRESGDKIPAVLRVNPTWGGLRLTTFVRHKYVDVVHKMYRDIFKWIDENNLLKGEKFSLSGQFIEKTDCSWDDVFLTEKNLKALQLTISHLDRKKKAMPNRGILIMGPPGTGKTLSGRIMANTLKDVTFIWISARDFYYAGSFGGISMGFDMARELSPSVLFIEDIDNWLHERTTDLLKTEMDGLKTYTGVVTILTSNHPETLPPALIDRPGRFHDVLNFDLPDPFTRSLMIHKWTDGEVVEKDLDDIVQKTAGYSGAHVFELIAFAKSLMEDDEDMDMLEALRRSLEKIDEQRELIQSIRGGEKTVESQVLSIADDDVPPVLKLMDDYTHDKEGRVLSTKNRTTIKKAIDGMEVAVIALKDLMTATDTAVEESSPAVDISGGEKIINIVNDVEEKGLSEEKIVSLIQKHSPPPLDVDDLERRLKRFLTGNMKDEIDRLKGRMMPELNRKTMFGD